MSRTDFGLAKVVAFSDRLGSRVARLVPSSAAIVHQLEGLVVKKDFENISQLDS